MLTAVKNQIKVTFISVKYALMREMLNKTTFLMNVIFMILNNASFILQWVVIYSLKSDVGGYSFGQVLLLWGTAASTFGFAHFFFKKSFSLSDAITNGKLDSYLVQPKNVLISAITSDVEPSAIGDLIYGVIMLIVSGLTIPKVLLFILFTISGGITMTSFAVILASLSFWFGRADSVADTGNGMITHFATYPDGIFHGISKIILYTIIPAGIINYIPVSVMTTFDVRLTLLVLAITVGMTALAFLFFYRGLRRYSSSNLMIAKI
ncbi:MAG: ABC-2 family transporter protein [Clostridia bacterium]|nr:ABC-2 family transporter protein [Clostridia bacterium]